MRVAFFSQYPAFWVNLDDLFDALNTTDISALRTRGWLEVLPR